MTENKGRVEMGFIISWRREKNSKGEEGRGGKEARREREQEIKGKEGE